MNAVTLHAWPSQVRLPGQAVAHPGPVDLTRTYLMHHALRRDLVDFGRAVASTPLTETVTWLSMASRWRLFAKAVRHHHEAEDAGLRPVLRTLTDAWHRAMLDELEGEHQAIDEVLAAATRGFERVTPPPHVAAHACLVGTIERAAGLITGHLEREERETLRVLQEVLTQAQWAAIEEAHWTGALSAAETVAHVPWLLHRVPPPVRRDHLARAGRAEHLVWLATHPIFTRRERLAFAYTG